MANTSALEAVFAKVDKIQDSLVENIEEFKVEEGVGGAETVVATDEVNEHEIDADKQGIWTKTASGQSINLESAKGTFVAGNEGLKANYLTETGTQTVQGSKNVRQAVNQAVTIR